MEVVWKGSGGKQTTARNTDVGQTEASDPGAGQTGAVYVTMTSPSIVRFDVTVNDLPRGKEMAGEILHMESIGRIYDAYSARDQWQFIL